MAERNKFITEATALQARGLFALAQAHPARWVRLKTFDGRYKLRARERLVLCVLRETRK
jgi:hypothetical protein